jgi:hypothetical protein
MILGKVLSVMVCLLLIAGYAEARNGNSGNAPVTGTIVCGGFYNVSPDPYSPTQRFRLVLKNINEQADIKIVRGRIYFKDGSLAVDSNVTGELPPGLNGILGPENDTLEPHQTELYYSEYMFGWDGGIPPLQTGSVQIVIDWESTGNAAPLKASLVRHIYRPYESKPTARSSGKCDVLQ